MSSDLKLSNKDIIDLNLMCQMMTFTISHAFSTGMNCVPSLYTKFQPREIEEIKNFTYKLMKKVIEEEDCSDNISDKCEKLPLPPQPPDTRHIREDLEFWTSKEMKKGK